MVPPPSATVPSKKSLLAASLVGTSIEWHDYYIFGIAAALVFGGLFFPSSSSVASTLAAFAARPLSAVVIGHFGDKIGHKSMLVLNLLIIGVGAPMLLVILRFVQGFGVGGEWGGPC